MYYILWAVSNYYSDVLATDILCRLSMSFQAYGNHSLLHAAGRAGHTLLPCILSSYQGTLPGPRALEMNLLLVKKFTVYKLQM